MGLYILYTPEIDSRDAIVMLTTSTGLSIIIRWYQCHNLQGYRHITAAYSGGDGPNHRRAMVFNIWRKSKASAMIENPAFRYTVTRFF